MPRSDAPSDARSTDFLGNVPTADAPRRETGAAGQGERLARFAAAGIGGPLGDDSLPDRPLPDVSLSRLLDDLGLTDKAVIRDRSESRPAWLLDLIDCVAELFEPLRETARVGYECRPAAGRWELDVFLGPNETVGGAQDGLQQVPSFRFDLRALFQCFDRIDSCQWLAAPSGEAGVAEQAALPAGFSQLLVEGVANGESIAVSISSLPPERIGVGLKIFGDGSAQRV